MAVREARVHLLFVHFHHVVPARLDKGDCEQILRGDGLWLCELGVQFRISDFPVECAIQNDLDAVQHLYLLLQHFAGY